MTSKNCERRSTEAVRMAGHRRCRQMATVVVLTWGVTCPPACPAPAEKAEESREAALGKARAKALSLFSARKAEEAVKVLDGIVGEAKTLEDAKVAAEILCSHAYVCGQVKRHEDALASAQECIRRFKAAEQSAVIFNVSQCEFFAARALRELKRKKEALAMILNLFDKYRADTRARLGLRLAMNNWSRWGPEFVGLDEAIKVHQQNVGNALLGFRTGGGPTPMLYQLGMVQMCRKAKNVERLLAEAKLYYYLVPLNDAHTKEAIRYLTTTLKAHDGTIHRVNQFLNYQRYGPVGQDGKADTADDLKNVLPEIEVPTTPERDKALQEALDRQPDNYRGHGMRGYAYLFMDKPKEGMAEFKIAYQQCPLEEAPVQQAVDDDALGLRAYHGTALAAQRFLEFQEYGPNGADGKKGTEDDIDDPLKEF